MHMQAWHRACVLLSLQPTQHSAASLGSSEMEETNVNEEVTEGFLEEATPDRMYLVWRREMYKQGPGVGLSGDRETSTPQGLERGF